MERLKALMGRRDRIRRVEFARDLVTVLLTDKEIYADEVLFRDAIEEIYRALREEVVGAGNRDLIDAYDTAVILRAVVLGRLNDVDTLLNELNRSLRG